MGELVDEVRKNTSKLPELVPYSLFSRFSKWKSTIITIFLATAALVGVIDKTDPDPNNWKFVSNLNPRTPKKQPPKDSWEKCFASLPCKKVFFFLGLPKGWFGTYAIVARSSLIIAVAAIFFWGYTHSFSINTCDQFNSYKINLPNAATPIMQGIIDLHDNILFFLTLILVFVLYLLFITIWDFTYTMFFDVNYVLFNKTKIITLIKERIFLNSKYTWLHLTSGIIIEIIWTIFPGIILLFIAIPSFALLYAMDEVIDPVLTIKVIGHQWYWTYEYYDFCIFTTYPYDIFEFIFNDPAMREYTASTNPYFGHLRENILLQTGDFTLFQPKPIDYRIYHMILKEFGLTECCYD